MPIPAWACTTARWLLEPGAVLERRIDPLAPRPGFVFMVLGQRPSWIACRAYAASGPDMWST